MVICLGGITAHVARKTTQAPEETKNQSRSIQSKRKYQRDYSVLSQSTSETESDDEMYLNISRPNTNTKKTITSSNKCDTAVAQPLLWHENESEFSSDEEAFQLNSLNKGANNITDINRTGEKSWNNVSDDFFLRENRSWTSIKDAHVKMLNDTISNNESNAETDQLKLVEHRDEILISTEES
jgi:hypothetical protein